MLQTDPPAGHAAVSALIFLAAIQDSAFNFWVYRACLTCFALQIGKVNVGSKHRVALQTMTTTDTRNIQATVDQVSG